MQPGGESFLGLWQRAVALHHKGEVGEAEAAYRRLLELEPGHPDVLTNLAGLVAESGREPEAARMLESALADDPHHARARAQQARLRFVMRRAADPSAAAEIRGMHAVLDGMNRELKRKDIYVPGAFWAHFGALHVYLLERYGIGNFKRTVAHNYQNWFMADPADHQVRRLAELWATRLDSRPLPIRGDLPDDLGFHTSRSFPFYVLSAARAFQVHLESVGRLWEYTLATDEHGILAGLAESPVGNPLGIRRNETLISSDLAHSVRERNQMLRHCGLRGDEGIVVGELGAGNGRLAEIFGRTTNFRYWIFDVTPALYVSQWYVGQLFPREKIFGFRPFDSYAEIERELSGARFAFFTANQIELLPPGAVDLFVNINSLMEMAAAQIENFLLQIDRVTARWLFLQQWYRWHNAMEGVLVTKESFRPAPGWDLVVEAANEVYPDFFVQVWRRAARGG